MKNKLIIILTVLSFIYGFKNQTKSKKKIEQSKIESMEHQEMLDSMDQKQWEELDLNELDLPFELTFMRKSMGSNMFAEYYRQIRTKTIDDEIQTHGMFSNVGGATFINIFMLRDTSRKEILWLKDSWSDHCLDMESIKLIGKLGDQGGEQNIPNRV